MTKFDELYDVIMATFEGAKAGDADDLLCRIREVVQEAYRIDERSGEE